MNRSRAMKTIAIAVMLLASVAAADAQTRITTQLFDASGDRIGMATEIGGTTTFYDVAGRKTGSSRTIGNVTIHYDARGRKIGAEKRRATSPPAGTNRREGAR